MNPCASDGQCSKDKVMLNFVSRPPQGVCAILARMRHTHELRARLLCETPNFHSLQGTCRVKI